MGVGDGFYYHLWQRSELYSRARLVGTLGGFENSFLGEIRENFIGVSVDGDYRAFFEKSFGIMF